MISANVDLERLAVMTATAWLESVSALEYAVDEFDRLRLCNSITIALRAVDIAARVQATAAAVELMRHVTEEVAL